MIDGIRVTDPSGPDQADWAYRDASLAAVYHVRDSRLGNGQTTMEPHMRRTYRVSGSGRVDVWNRQAGWLYVADYQDPSSIDTSTAH
ncbi:MAG TPA: hypothetical protein VFE69_00990, partial [Ilumatobacteraceae bacterium]|nr:hypothetical protein [Ilumatobacteraceae bacterium]